MARRTIEAHFHQEMNMNCLKSFEIHPLNPYFSHLCLPARRRQFIELKKIAILPTPEDSACIIPGAINANGNLLAGDSMSCRIYKLDPYLKLLATFGSEGPSSRSSPCSSIRTSLMLLLPILK
jgi:hypothetical protein